MIACLSPNGATSFTLGAPPTSLLVGSSTGVVRFRRADADQPWRQVGTELAGKHIGALVSAPGGRVFAGSHHGGGLFRSEDDGVSWSRIGEEIVATDIFSLALMESGSGSTLLAGVEPVSLYRSDDWGDTWREEPSISHQPGGELWSFPPPPHLPHLKSITVDPSAPNTFYGCVEQGALLKTENGGRDWVELTTMWRDDDMAYRDAHRLVVAPWNPRQLIFASGVGVYVSQDAGASWIRNAQVSQIAKYPDVLVASPSDRSLFVGGPVDVPGNWPGGNPSGALCRSTDEGSSWRTLGLVAEKANFEALTIVTHPGGYTLFAGDTSGRISASEDAGETWTTIGATSPVSKGAHYKLAEMSVKLPRRAGAMVTRAFYQATRVTSHRAAARRRAEFRARAVKDGRV
jgi:photosystem II stability/assembly factor-like uncharacterized protein